MSFAFIASSLLLTTIITAQSTPPIPCNVVLETFANCGGSSLTDSSSKAEYEAFNKCFCLDPSYPVVAQECLNQLNPNDPFGRSTASAVQSSEQFCAVVAQVLANGGSDGTSDVDAAVCNPLDRAISSCSVTDLPGLTSASAANCLCSANIEDNIGACFSYLSTAQPTIASGLSVLNRGYCEAYATGFSNPTPTQGSEESTTNSGESTTTSSGAASSFQPCGFTCLSIFVTFAILL